MRCCGFSISDPVDESAAADPLAEPLPDPLPEGEAAEFAVGGGMG